MPDRDDRYEKRDMEHESRDRDRLRDRDRRYSRGEDSMRRGPLREYLIVVIMTLIIIVVGYLSYTISAKLHTPSEPDITGVYISSRLENMSDLTAAELTYTGLIRYSDGKIPFITQKAFSMIYTAEVKAGIDLSKVEVTVTDDKVIVRMPEVTVQSIYVNPDSIEFFDENSALFNWSDKQDAIDAIAAAEDDVAEKADIEGLKARASDQAESLIRGILADTIGERTLEIR